MVLIALSCFKTSGFCIITATMDTFMSKSIHNTKQNALHKKNGNNTYHQIEVAKPIATPPTITKNIPISGYFCKIALKNTY